MPSSVYSCSIPNQGWLSLTKSMIFLHVCLRLVSGDREGWVRPVPWAGTHHALLHPTSHQHWQVLPTEALREPVRKSPLPAKLPAHPAPPCRATPSPQHQATDRECVTSLIPKPPPMVHEHPPPLTHQKTRSYAPALSCRHLADLGTGTIHLPSLIHPQLNHPSLSPAPGWLVELRAIQALPGNIQIAENHPNTGQHARIEE